MTLNQLIEGIIRTYPGIRGYVIEIMLGKKYALGTVSSQLSKLSKNGKVIRVKDGDSFRYYGVE
jgi:DNA-binding transcriptional ArsR family regulator